MGPAHFSLVQLLQLAAVSACIGWIAAVERKGALQLMLSRPLVLSPLLGWALGDAAGGLALGLPLGLLFLGGLNLGGSIPQNETLLSAVLTAALVPAGRLTGRGVDPALAALGLALLYPLPPPPPSRLRAPGAPPRPPPRRPPPPPPPGG